MRLEIGSRVLELAVGDISLQEVDAIMNHHHEGFSSRRESAGGWAIRAFLRRRFGGIRLCVGANIP